MKLGSMPKKISRELAKPAPPPESEPKRVVYLLGAGASQADISLKDETISILMSSIREGIVRRIDREKIGILEKVKNELVKEDLDVEHLITLYESTGISEHENIAKKLKSLFWKEIRDRISKLGPNYQPRLLAALIDMHEISELNERLHGILTLNYEGLIEKAIQLVRPGAINYGLTIISKVRSPKTGHPVPLIKLHGSFNWKNEFPIALRSEGSIRSAENVLWIPPGVEKKRERYPFNILWGKARELLDCDILRIVGCSLNRNDWQLVSLLYTTQQLNTHQKEYIIELIDFAKAGEIICANYGYLNFRKITAIREVIDYIRDSFAPVPAKEADFASAIKELLSPGKNNIFDIWLRAKGDYMKKNNIPISTVKGIFRDYINEVRG